MRIVFIHIILFTLLGRLSAQEVSFYQSYLVIPELHNPAYTGALPCTKLSLADKHQWLGISGAPNQQTLSANLRFELDKFRKQGMGLVLLADHNGANSALGARAAYSYHIMVQKAQGHWLSLALSASLYNKRLDASNFIANNMNDPIIQAGSHSANKFDAAFGLLYYGKAFNIGIAAFQLVPTSQFTDQSSRTTPLGVLHADFSFVLSPSSSLIPGARLLYERNQHLSADINLKYIYQQRYWIALSPRIYTGAFDNTANALIFHAGLNYKRFEFSYAADFGLTSLQRKHYASHQVSIAILFCKKENSCTD